MSDQEYVLLDEIGEGAFGKVYKSRKESTQEILAAKVRIVLLKSPGSPIKLIPQINYSQIVRCTAPEGIDLALAEMWTLSKVSFRARNFSQKYKN